jgi:hypothetical protein
MSRLHPNYSTALYLAAIFAAFFWAQWDDNRGEWRESDNLIAVQQEEQAKASREFAGRAVCGPGAAAQWISDQELQCVPKRGKGYAIQQARNSHE